MAAKKKSSSDTATTKPAAEDTRLCDPAKITTGDFFSRHSFGSIEGRSFGGRFSVQNQDGFSWQVDENIIAQEFSIAGQFETEETVSRTRAIEILTENPYTAMQITFRKKPDAKAVAEALSVGKGEMTDRAWSKLVREQMAGEQREMKGYHRNHYDEHRRLNFSEAGVGNRLVDPRTVEEIIVRRTKFKVKK